MISFLLKKLQKMNRVDNALCFSDNRYRNKHYAAFLQLFDSKNVTVADIIDLGYKLMRKGRLHPHFFGKNSLLDTALYLTFFALDLPYTWNNEQFFTRLITPTQALKIIGLFEKRICLRIPVEYITQETWYSGFQFYVNENVLVPRSIMNTRFHDFLNDQQWDNYRVLDLCTGSGCIGITLALLHPKIKVDLVDISEKALEVAKINIKKHNLEDRVRCLQNDLFGNIESTYDLIITNPPYVSVSEYNSTPTEFKNEPKIALEAGKEGLDIIHRILNQAKNYLNPKGKLIAEVGFTTAKRMKKRYPNIPFQWLKYRRPSGKEVLLGMDGVFICEADGLPS